MTHHSLKEKLDSLGLLWVTLLLLAVTSGLIYAGPALWQTWTHNGPSLVTEGSGAGDGFVAGHDFVAFYSASQLALDGKANLAYDESAMAGVQRDLVGDSTVGYLAFMYPPTYLLMVAPLSVLPYFPALALWLILPLCAFLYSLGRGIAISPAALLLVITAPAVEQVLFAGQNGLLFAALLTSGLLLHESRPAAAGILLGLATAKPHLAILIFPVLVAGRHWVVLITALGTVIAMIILSAALFGVEIWQIYTAVPGVAREWLAAGRLPWPRMPTVYTAIRLVGGSDTLAGTVQILSALAVLGSVAWVWWRGSSPHLRCAALLAGAPLTTPFLYDYDLPFMLAALGLFIEDANARGWHGWEKPLLLIVWLQPIWWWTLSATAWHFSIAPLVYGLFFLAVLRRTTENPGRWGLIAKNKGVATP